MAKSNFSPIGKLLSNSWKTFKENLITLIFWLFIGIGLNIVVFIVGLLVALPLGGFTLFQIFTGKPNLATLLPSIGGLVILGIILSFVFIVLSYILQIGSILIVGKGQKNYGQLLKNGLSLALPLFITNLLSFFIVFGSFFIFIIPAIIFQIAFAFVSYEVILNDQKYGAALRRSMKIIFSNFGPLFVRFLVIIGIYILVAFLPSIIINGANRNAGGFYGFISFFINLALGWFVLCYNVNLYKEARRGFEKDKGSKLLIPMLIAIVGWVVSILLITTLIGFITTMVSNNLKSAKPIPVKQQLALPSPTIKLPY